MAAAYERIRRWAGCAAADRVCSTHGMAVLQGLPLRVPDFATEESRLAASTLVKPSSRTASRQVAVAVAVKSVG